ncbi:MAG: hypothetical protein NC229_03740, partial [Bacteroides sp.]|nr:hypothetical protein [Bacteroides sp.]MCM1403033.1 hypothetical protein [Bacteroides sp.]MCM1442830.1 hypothetical protein [Muribaculum sp.]MCM1576193.1 hypothetical protein [Bacteroides sp.]
YLLDVLGIDKYTILAKDGLSIVVDAKHSFSVSNNTKFLDVTMNGLPTSMEDARFGGLYIRQDGLLSIRNGGG